MGWDIEEVPGGTGGNVVASEFGSKFHCSGNFTNFDSNVHIIIKLVYNSCLNKRMVNCSGAIDVSLGYKTYKILVRQ